MKKKKQESPRSNRRHVPFIIGILAIAVLFTHKTIHGGELNYDDERYITHNELIKELTAENVGKMFTDYFDGHYHPLTLLSLAVDGAIFADPIKGHHVVNWLLHLANAVLAYLFLFALFREQWVAFGAALLFALHPMSVESYAWMTERKNVLYSFFFLASGIVYLRYLSKRTWQTLAWCFFLFVLSILSKAQAMMLIPVLFLVDWVAQRDFRESRIYLEKLPFLVIAVAFVFLTSSAQVEEWGELNTSGYTRFEKFFLACTAFFQYFTKGIAPIDLAAYYPYPKDVGQEMAWYHFASPAFLLLFLMAAIYAFRKSIMIFFGLAFFFINVVMMLKFLDVPFGSYLMADRYNYLPLIGLMLILVLGLFYLARRIGRSSQTKGIMLLCIALPYGVLAYNRIKVWNNNTALWTDIIERYPGYQHAYNMRGLGYIATGNTRAAMRDFNTTLELDSVFEDGYMNLAVLHYQMDKPQEALKYARLGRKFFPDNPEVLKVSATLHLKVKDYEGALRDIEEAIAADPDNERYRFTKAQILVQSGQNAEARKILADIQSDPKARQLLAAIDAQNQSAPGTSSSPVTELIDQGTALARAGKRKEALAKYNEALAQDPQSVVAHLNRGSTHAQMGNIDAALVDFQKALELNPNEPRAHYMLGMAYRDLGRRDRSCAAFGHAVQAGFQLPPDVQAYCR